jgi:ureidoacrylate peracid hydrolase
MDLTDSALIIVDLQNDFLAADGAYARGGATNPAALELPQRVAAVAKAIKAGGGMVIASQFTLWPDAQGEPMIAPQLKALRPFLKRGDFAPASKGQALVGAIAPFVDVCVSKVAYSAFFNTQLDWILQHAHIQSLIICGIVTNGGVASTLRDAHMREYNNTVLSDGCAAFGKHHDVAIADMSSIAKMMSCAEYLATLR